MELSLPRNHKAGVWEIDKVRRWRSKNWRHWVRGLSCPRINTVPHPSPTGAFDFMIAAHFRYPGCGIGTKPADCLVYPMHDADHKAAHGDKQPAPELQWLWVTETMLQGLKWDKLGAELNARAWISELCVEAQQRRADLSTLAVETVADQWGRYFLAGDLWINKYNGGM
jgi:hypothetical protein